MLRYPTLEEDYAKAWDDWTAEEDEWESTVKDGLGSDALPAAWVVAGVVAQVPEGVHKSQLDVRHL